jgi:hypothetical protein
MADEVDFEGDPANQKMFESFKKVTMHQFWKKVKSGIRAAGDAEEKAEFNKLYKSFDMGLGKILDKFDKCFPDPAEMKKYAGQLDKIFSDYDKKIDKVDLNTKSRMGLSGCLAKLDTETKRRLAWAKKYVK